MLKEYTDEATFISEMVEIPDALCMLADKLHDEFGNYGPVILRSDKKSLSFAINTTKSGDKTKDFNNRVVIERGDNLYRITVEKV